MLGKKRRLTRIALSLIQTAAKGHAIAFVKNSVLSPNFHARQFRIGAGLAPLSFWAGKASPATTAGRRQQLPAGTRTLAGAAFSPDALMKTWLSLFPQNTEWAQKMFEKLPWTGSRGQVGS